MSGWQLGLALFGCFLLGGLAFAAATYFYARHVWRTKMGMLAGQLLSTSASGGAQSVTINKPPPS